MLQKMPLDGDKVLSNYNFSNTLSLLTSDTLVSLVSCSQCKAPLSGTTTFSAGYSI